MSDFTVWAIFTGDRELVSLHADKTDASMEIAELRTVAREKWYEAFGDYDGNFNLWWLEQITVH